MLDCHCLGAWDWWSGDTKFEETFSTQRDGHSAELAGATTNSDGKRRTFGYRSFNWSGLWLWAATLHGDRIAQTATMDVIDPARGLRPPQID